ncbi:uncharacterized protein LOC120127787 [Hibiscus syriacus]|uniref:uncharacterized protein LOC120127787 n=1 Tax=Hibiscus syriacus TaxID=106335 RepID=UPI0019213885|nr:uncharacterized protein LOC120127787 [Hibiscus syriacus]
MRQGDPLSPYLFVIVMNVLSSLLDAAAKNSVFRFHPKCKRIPLTHLCFADDLLLFCHGSLDTMLGVVSTLEKFYELYGLKLNASKTELFACGVAWDELELIQRTTSFRIGHLPVRLFILPKGVIRYIEKLCLRFFWKGIDTLARGARVSWNQVCTLKSEGGLRLRKLADWSKAYCLMLIKTFLLGMGPYGLFGLRFTVSSLLITGMLPVNLTLVGFFAN